MTGDQTATWIAGSPVVIVRVQGTKGVERLPVR